MEELQAERSKTEAHIQSLKKRKADLSVRMRTEALSSEKPFGMHSTSDPSCSSLKRSTELMKQQVRECFESMQRVLKQDEQVVLDSLELDLRQTRTRLDQVIKDWIQHQEQVNKNISSTRAALSKTLAVEQDGKVWFKSCTIKMYVTAENSVVFLRNISVCVSHLKGQPENIR